MDGGDVCNGTVNPARRTRQGALKAVGVRHGDDPHGVHAPADAEAATTTIITAGPTGTAYARAVADRAATAQGRAPAVPSHGALSPERRRTQYGGAAARNSRCSGDGMRAALTLPLRRLAAGGAAAVVNRTRHVVLGENQPANHGCTVHAIAIIRAAIEYPPHPLTP